MQSGMQSTTDAAECVAPPMQNNMEASQEAPRDTFQHHLAAYVLWHNKRMKLESEAKEAKEEEDRLKELVKLGFEELGVSSMKYQGQTVYVHKQLWAGTGENATAFDVAQELHALNMQHMINFNTQSLSGYVRELAKDHPEFIDRYGTIVVEPEQILAVLPGRLPSLCKVTERVDLKIRKS